MKNYTYLKLSRYIQRSTLIISTIEKLVHFSKENDEIRSGLHELIDFLIEDTNYQPKKVELDLTVLEEEKPKRKISK